MKLIVNGAEHEHGGDGRLASLLSELGADAQRVAILVNDAVVTNGAREAVCLAENDRVEILAFAGGG